MSENTRRVGAILGAGKETKTVRFFGYGNYVGDFVPSEAVGFFADILKRVGAPNPKIELDNGEVVYGCECWWGDEWEVSNHIDSYIKDGWAIEDVLPSSIRNNFREADNDQGAV